MRAREKRRRRRRRAALVVGPVVLALVAVVGWVTIGDIRYHDSISVVRSRVANATDTGEVRALKRAAVGRTVTGADLAQAVAFVRGENDGADFRLVTLLRLRLGYPDRLAPDADEALRSTLLGMRYWMTEPGTNGLVYWSENHQVLFATAEYLAGQLYPDDRFRDGRTGRAHHEEARDRLLFWLAQRWRYGFSEWNSHYYAEDVAALSDLVDFAGDGDLRGRATMVLDRLLLDVASRAFRGEFISASGRLYENNRTTGDDAIRRILRHAFEGADVASASDAIDINFLLSSYRTPPVLAAIAGDPTATAITSTAGRNLADLDADASLTTAERRIMAQWGMEAFTNPEAVDTSVDWIRAHGLLANPYLSAFRQLDYRALRAVGALPLISRRLDLPTNGTALQRADVYGYRTADYAMSTTQDYQPGAFGNQEAVVQLTLDRGLSLFHNHPAVRPGEPSPNGSSPGYWTGDGYLPVSCQSEGVSLSVYDLPDHSGRGRSAVLEYTHLRVPFARFDRVELAGNRLLLQRGTVLVAVTGATALRRTSDEEVVQDGRRTWWVVEASSTRAETFAAFAERVRAARVSFDGTTLTYAAPRRTLTASTEAGCTADGSPIAVPYGRVPAPYARTDGSGDRVTVEFGGRRLDLDYAKGTRVQSGSTE
ncbi:hypothetical protein [Kineosporia sp. R_H_3]|uniref:hypothetical protein n=1 Tax=Kineosporia sp. R_H_3 TaxID=1961848 RepID=UPI00117AC6EE|nr:hypothetical protein [Kineosporia sp. R_H_3]